MTLKPIANTNLTIDAKEISILTANFSITSFPKFKVKAEGNPVYSGNMTVLVSGVTTATCTQTGPPVPAIITPTATKVKAEGSLVIREDDESAQISIPGTTGSTGCTILLTAVVSDAGQTKAKAQ
jgi:hypothetical protein